MMMIYMSNNFIKSFIYFYNFFFHSSQLSWYWFCAVILSWRENLLRRNENPISIPLIWIVPLGLVELDRPDGYL